MCGDDPEAQHEDPLLPPPPPLAAGRGVQGGGLAPPLAAAHRQVPVTPVHQPGRQTGTKIIHVFFIFCEDSYFSVSQKYLLIPQKYFFSLDRLDGRAAHGGAVLAKH